MEIAATRDAGATAVGVASDEEFGCLRVDEKKRGWLIAAGADYIIPNYLDEGVMRIVEAEI